MKLKIIYLKCLLVGCLCLSTGHDYLTAATKKSEPKSLRLYTERKTELIQPVIDLYESKYGVKIEVHSDGAEALIKKLEAEKKNQQADLLMTVDAGNLVRAKKAGLWRTTDSEILQKNIPEHLRDPDNQWFSLSLRARTIVYNPEKVKADDLKEGYRSLSLEPFKGRLCLRTSQKIYNQSLVAMFLADPLWGPQKTEQMVKGWVSNLAAPVKDNDTKVILSVAGGECDVGIVNTYYFGREFVKDPKIKAALFFPTAEQGGVHVNVSGAGVTKFAREPEEAKRFLEFLTTAEAQTLFSQANQEYPVNPAVVIPEATQKWSSISVQDLVNLRVNIASMADQQPEAVKLFKRVGYN